MKVAIIGGGASGISAAISIKKNNPQCDVTILERFDRIGKKLLATGNGKCNIGNLNISPTYYNESKLTSTIINKMPIESYTTYLKELGIYLYSDSEGRIYPYSNSSKTVLDILLRNIEKHNIKVITNFNVINLTKEKNVFKLESDDKKALYFDKVIFSVGSSSQTKEVSALKLLEKYGHTVKDFTPKLVPIKVKEKVKDISGLRFKVNAKLFVEEKLVFSEDGEVLFKDEGIGGIVILNLSRHIVENKKNVISLNLINNINFDLDDYLKTNKMLSKEELLEGIVNKSMAHKLAKVPQRSIKELLTDFRLTVISDYGLNQSQVSRGGVSVNEIDFDTFESTIIPGAFVIGEALDVDGACGGFNLYFAISCGAILGKNLFTN